MWHEDRWRPLICSLVNLVVNLILVQFWGLYGILISTIIAMLVVGMPWLTHNLFTVVFHCSWKPYVGRTHAMWHWRRFAAARALAFVILSRCRR